MIRIYPLLLVILCASVVVVVSCQEKSSKTPKKQKIGMVLDTGGEFDKSFNEYSLKGAHKAADEAGVEFIYATSESAIIYEQNIVNMIAEGTDLVITVGFTMGDATAKAARKYPHIKFIIIDYAFRPGFGCPEGVNDCYTAEGGLSNVTSLMFAEDEPAYLAGILAGCMTRSGIVASVAGLEIPPVKRFVIGFQNGARSVNPGIHMLNHYIPDFNDPDTGKVVAQQFISQGADIIFGVGGNTGNGGLLAAKEAGLMGIGVDVDQYLTFPEVKSSLITSVMKKVDVAAESAVNAFLSDTLRPGIRQYSLKNGGVGLAPFHEWEDKVSPDCRKKIESARQAIIADPSTTNTKYLF